MMALTFRVGGCVSCIHAYFVGGNLCAKAVLHESEDGPCSNWASDERNIGKMRAGHVVGRRSRGGA